MTNEPDTEAYRMQAELALHHLHELQKDAREAQVEYGKWLINTLWLMHAGSIVGLLFKAPGPNPPPYVNSLWWFVVGIALAFGAGFSAWWNFTFTTVLYQKWADTRMLADRQYWPAQQPTTSLVVTLWICILCGVGSLLCLIGGAAAVWLSWH